MEECNNAVSKTSAIIVVKNVKAAQRDAFLKALDELLRSIRQHPQMQDNPHDGLTPKPLFFAWDFVQRTRSKLAQIPADMLEADDKDALEAYNDCMSRAIMAEKLVTEHTTETAVMRGGELDFGYGTRKAAKAAAVAGGGEAGKRHV